MHHLLCYSRAIVTFNGLELYNLGADPNEKTNVAQDQSAKRAELHALLVDWRRDVKAPVPTERNPEFNN